MGFTRYPLVCDLAAEGVPVVVACGVLAFSPQGYYRWLADPVSDRDWGDAHLVNVIIDIHADDPEFGYRFIADELGRLGHQVGENRVARLCREDTRSPPRGTEGSFWAVSFRLVARMVAQCRFCTTHW